MRGSIYYQATQLVQVIFKEGLKKEQRADPQNEYFGMVASYETMQSYRRVWENFFAYLKEHFGLKDVERIEADHVQAYMEYKIEYYPSKQYLEKISAAMGKLEMALSRYSALRHDEPKSYNFSIRQKLLDSARDLDLVADNYHNRAYEKPYELIQALQDPLHRLAATMQFEGGARLEGVGLIKPDQLQGLTTDPITQREVGVVQTKEKGGKVGDVMVLPDTYRALESHITQHKLFRIDRQAYMYAIRNTCIMLGIEPEGSHGLRWSFAKRRMFEYAQAGYSYAESLQMVSTEMKHHRASITEHYLGG